MARKEYELTTEQFDKLQDNDKRMANVWAELRIMHAERRSSEAYAEAAE